MPDRLPAPLVHQDGGAEGVQRVLEECEVEAHQSSEPPCIITVSTAARAEQRSHRSAAVRGRAGSLSSEAFISATPPRPSGDFFDIKCSLAHRDKSPHFGLTLVPT
jgi:hypothetical protein